MEDILEYNSEGSSASAEKYSTTEYVTEITHEASGITYHFSEAVEVGHYWNGDIFVVNNLKDITITKITPESNPLSEGRVLNGAVLQPDNSSFTAFDSEGQPDYYRDYTNFEAHNIDPGKTGQPIVIKYSEHPEGASLVKGVSIEDLSNSRDRSAIEEFSVLTIVKDVPLENAFRPPVSGTDKTSHYTIDDLDFTKLQNVEILDSQTDISKFDLYKTATFASWTTSGDPARYTHPNKYHDGYGDYQMDAMTHAFMALHSNYSDAEKADLYAALVQTGIDYAGTIQAGKAWGPAGGLNNQIKPFVVLAAVGLNSKELAETADPATNGYSEDKQFRYVDESLIGAELFDWGGNKLPKFGEEYQDAHLGMPEWFIVEGSDRADPSLDAAYRWINSNNLPITALVMEMLGDGEGREIWNNEAYFDYADRIQNINDIELYKSLHKPQEAWIDFIDAYAQQFSTQPEWTGVPEAVSDLEAQANGAGISVRIDGPKYDGGSDIIRTDFRYSTDRENWVVLEDVSDEFTVLNLPENTPLFVQARYVNSHGEGPWTGNSFQTRNSNLVRELLEAGIITEEFIIQNGDYARFTTTEAYKAILNDILDGDIKDNEINILRKYVDGVVITGAGLSFASGSPYIDENVEIGTIVGTLSGTADGIDLSYQMATPSDYFSVEGLNVITKAEINYEEFGEHRIDIRITGAGTDYTDQISLKVNDVEEPVTDFVVSIDPISEDTAVGTVVGTFSAYDDDGEQITFKASNNPSYDNATFREYFDIVGDQIVLTKSLDTDVFSSLRLLFYTSTPSGMGLNWTPYKISIVEASPSITLPEEPDDPVEPETSKDPAEPIAPEDPDKPETDDDPGDLPSSHTPVTDFVVSIDPISEDTAVGTVVGTFSAYDDDGEQITFKASGNPTYDGATFHEYFDIVGDQIVLTKSLDTDVFSSLRLLFYTSTPSGLGLNWTPYKISIVEASPSITLPEEPEAIPADPATDPIDLTPLGPATEASEDSVLTRDEGDAGDMSRSQGGDTSTKDDLLIIGDEKNILLGTALNDTISAFSGNDNVSGFSGDDLLFGGGGNDIIKGAAGADRLRGDHGKDTLKGGGGGDNIKGNSGGDLIFGGAGADWLIGGGGADTLRGNDGDDTLKGGGGGGDIRGNGGADLIIGGAGADYLIGGSGADTLRGNGGSDTLKGGSGADVFQFSASDGKGAITDFRQGLDKIQILKGAQSFAALRIEQDGDDVLISVGAAGQVRIIANEAGAFDEDDFIF